MDYAPFPIGLNLEVNNICPLHCPECYCSLEGGKSLDFNSIKPVLRDAAGKGLRFLNISGGETLLYPQLEELLSFCKEHGMRTNVATSGFGLTGERLENLEEAGLNSFFLSLNGSTEQINQKTRNGYTDAMTALKIISEYKAGSSLGFYVNFCVTRENFRDIPAMAELCRTYQIPNLVLLKLKPYRRTGDAGTKDEMVSALQLTRNEIRELERIIKSEDRGVRIQAECCYSELLAYLNQSFLKENSNVGLLKGCGAGIYLASINVDGRFTPCRHMDAAEVYNSVERYWKESPVLQKIRKTRQNCQDCLLVNNCRYCLAENFLNGEISRSNRECGCRIPVSG